MKHPTFGARMSQALITLTCLITVLLLSQCKGTHKGGLQTNPASTEQSVISNTKGTPPETTPDIDESIPPIGFWTIDGSRLYVSIAPLEKKLFDDAYDVAIGERMITVGGPPNRRNNADDIFFISKQTLEKNKLTLTGAFQWDHYQNEVEIQVSWTSSSVELEILKNEQFTHYEAKLYVLKLRK